jgi:hypothetical protein
MLATVCEVCAEGRAAMDAGNQIGPEGAASLAPVLEKMTQLTSLTLKGALIRFWARPSGAGGSGALVHAVGYALGCDVVWLGYALEGGRCVRRFARCVLRGRAAMDADNGIGPEGAASLAPALEKMPQLTSLDLGSALIRSGRGLRGLGGPGHWCVLLGTRLDAMWCGWGTCLRAGDACDGLRVVCAEGAGGDGCRQLDRT